MTYNIDDYKTRFDGKNITFVDPAAKLEEEMIAFEKDKTLGLSEKEFRKKCINIYGNINAVHDILRAEKITSFAKEIDELCLEFGARDEKVVESYKSVISSCEKIIKNLQFMLNAYEKGSAKHDLHYGKDYVRCTIRTVVEDEEFRPSAPIFLYQLYEAVREFERYHKQNNIDTESCKTEYLIDFFKEIVAKGEDEDLVFQSNFIVKQLEEHLLKVPFEKRSNAVSSFVISTQRLSIFDL